MSARSQLSIAVIAAVIAIAVNFSPSAAQEDSVRVVPPIPEHVGEATYHLEPVEGGLRGLRDRFSPDQILMLQKLNRRSLKYLVLADSIIVPDEWRPDPLYYSPFPATFDWAARHYKALVIHHPSQAFGAYGYGRLVRWGPVSSGRKSLPTPSGLFHLNWKSEGRSSTIDPDWYMPWYFNFENRRGLSLHQYVLPGYPASHACERLLEPDAIWIFHWGEGWTLASNGWEVLETGTPLLIIGQYDHGSPPPWMSPEWAAEGITLPEDPVLERSDR